MTTHRVTNRTRFLVVDQATVNDATLSFKALGLLTWLLDKPDDWRVDASAIARNRPDGRRAILSGLKELEEAGYIVRSKQRDDKNRWTSSTAIHERPVPGVRFCADAKRDAAEGDVGQPPPVQAPTPRTETAAAAASSSSSPGELPLGIPATEPEPRPMALIAQACQTAAVLSHKADIAAGRGPKISNVGRYAMGRAADYQAKYGADLAAMEAAGAGEGQMIERIQRGEADPFVEHGPPEQTRPRLVDRTTTAVQGEFEEPVADVVAMDPRRRIAEAKAQLKQTDVAQ